MKIRFFLTHQSMWFVKYNKLTSCHCRFNQTGQCLRALLDALICLALLGWASRHSVRLVCFQPRFLRFPEFRHQHKQAKTALRSWQSRARRGELAAQTNQTCPKTPVQEYFLFLKSELSSSSQFI